MLIFKKKFRFLIKVRHISNKVKNKKTIESNLSGSDVKVWAAIFISPGKEVGATWVPAKDVEEFMFETLKTQGFARWDINVRYSPFTAEWRIEGKSKDGGNDLANMTYGTSRVSAYKIIEDALNLKETKVCLKK